MRRTLATFAALIALTTGAEAAEPAVSKPPATRFCVSVIEAPLKVVKDPEYRQHEWLALREGPGPQFKLITKLGDYEHLEADATQGDWTHISNVARLSSRERSSSRGVQGWVRSEYVKKFPCENETSDKPKSGTVRPAEKDAEWCRAHDHKDAACINPSPNMQGTPSTAATGSIPAVKDAEWCRAFDPQTKDPECIFPVVREPPAPRRPIKDEAWCRAHGWWDQTCVDLDRVRRAAMVKPVPLRLLPPPEYDKPFDGYLHIVRPQTDQEMIDKCNGAKFGVTLGPMACSMKLINRNDPSLKGCRILINTDEYLKRYGVPYDVVLRQELGHCNGWPSDHSGALPYMEWVD
jgi:hypothetical protein